jgi:hypothetical protein
MVDQVATHLWVARQELDFELMADLMAMIDYLTFFHFFN